MAASRTVERIMNISTLDRFLRKVKKTSSCWLWTGCVCRDGYGRFRDKDGVCVLAHVWSFIHFKGPIPKGLEVDHTCFVRHCVNPDHLEAVTGRVNVYRAKNKDREATAY